MTTLKDIIEKNRPDLSTGSITTYVGSLKNIAKHSGFVGEKISDYVQHYDEIIKYLKTMKPNVRKSKMAAIIVLLDDKHNEVTKSVGDVIEKYKKFMKEDKETIDSAPTQELSDKQKENLIPWLDVMRIYEKLKNDTRHLWNKETLTVNDWYQLQKYILLSLYVLNEPRRSKDYCSFKIRNINTVYTPRGNNNENYMINPRGKKSQATFVFNDYKNANRLGPQRVEVPPELKKIIVRWINKNPYEYLLFKGDGNKIGQVALGRMLNDIFKPKDISSSMLRHIWLTHKYGDVNLDHLIQSAHNMGNSSIDQILKYVQKPGDKVESDE